MTTTCGTCGNVVPARSRGRPARYCSAACKAKAYRARKRGGTGGGPGSRAASARPSDPQGLADVLWRDVLALADAARAGQEGREVDADTVTAAASAARQGLAELIARARRSAASAPDLAPQPAAVPAERVENRKNVTKSGPGAVEDTSPMPVTKTVTETPPADDRAEGDRPVPSGTLRAVARLGTGWATDDDDVLWWQGTTRVGSVSKAWPGSGWQARHSTGRRVTTGAGTKDRYPSRIKALTALAAEFDRTRRERTPHADVPVDGLPDGWRLTQTLAEHDDGRWTLHTPEGEIAGTVTRDAYGGRRPEWRATGGDPGHDTVLRTTVTPDTADPARGSDFDLFRTRTAAARALAAWHDPDLYDL